MQEVTVIDKVSLDKININSNIPLAKVKNASI